MKKRILAILLTVCLAVGCLPLSANAATLTGSREELKEFLNCYLITNSYFSFDAEKALIPGWEYDFSPNALYYLLEMHPYDDSIYPGEARQCLEPYIYPGDDFDWSSDWSLIEKILTLFQTPLVSLAVKQSTITILRQMKLNLIELWKISLTFPWGIFPN